MQLTGLEHFHHDVRPPDELPLHIELGNGGPVGEHLDSMADRGVLENVHRVVIDAQVIKDRDGAAGKAALREQRRAFHEQQHVRARSEEHTSELQSLMRISYAVFCLKKK